MNKQQPRSHWAAIGAALGAISGASTVLSNVTGIIQLGHESLAVILLVLAATTIFLSVYTLSKRQQRNGFWGGVAGTALVLGFVMIAVAFVSIAKAPQDTPAVTPIATASRPPTTPPDHQTTTQPQLSPSATPLYQTTVTLHMNQGVDIDTGSTQPVDADSIGGDLDLALVKGFAYLEFHSSGGGLYSVEGTPKDIAQSCRDTINRHLATPTEQAAWPDRHYCLRTSQGKLAWVNVSRSNAFDSGVPAAEKTATLEISVWPQ